MGFLGVRIDDDLKKALDQTGRNKSDVVRDALRMYLELDYSDLGPEHQRMIKEIERLLDERLKATQDPLNCVKQKQGSPVAQEALNAVKRDSDADKPKSQDLIKAALNRILSDLDEGVEPMVGDVAQSLNLSPRSLGMYLRQVNIRAQPTGRKGVKGRYFTFDQREQITKTLDSLHD